MAVRLELSCTECPIHKRRVRGQKMGHFRLLRRVAGLLTAEVRDTGTTSSYKGPRRHGSTLSLLCPMSLIVLVRHAAVNPSRWRFALNPHYRGPSNPPSGANALPAHSRRRRSPAGRITRCSAEPAHGLHSSLRLEYDQLRPATPAVGRQRGVTPPSSRCGCAVFSDEVTDA